MDLLTTGVSNSSKARVKEIAEFIRSIHVSYTQFQSNVFIVE